MLSIALQIHRHILSVQCCIRYVDDSNYVNTIQVECFSSELQLLLLMNDEIVKKVKIIMPNDFFIPSSLSSDSNSSTKSGSTIVGRTTLTPEAQSVAECSFRLQISGADKLDHTESELTVDVKKFFSERFKNGGLWNLFCASCGAGLPLEPVLIESVQEYSESELSEGWFCHGNGPQEALQPSSRVLYLDDTSFYLYPRPYSHVNHKATAVLDKKCCNDHDIDSQKDACTDVSFSDSSGIICPSESAGDCCDPENIDQSRSQSLNSYDFSTSNFTPGQQLNHSTALNLNCAGVKNHNDLDTQAMCNSVTPNITSSCLKQTDSPVGSSTKRTCEDSKHSACDKNEFLSGSKVLYSAVECQSCGDILTSEKSSIPFVRFYIDKLMFKNSSFNDDHLEYAQKIALLSFWSLVTRSETSLLPSKLFLQSKVRGEELCLLLWIPSAPVAQFLLQDSVENISPEINLKTESVYKVLYFVGTSRSENVRSWRHDFGVDFYCVSDTMVKILAKMLDASSSLLPKTSGARGFSCSFLRAPSQLF